MFSRTVNLVYSNIKHPRYINEHEIENERAPRFLIFMKVGINIGVA